jgi:hypothetical protein
MSKTDKIVRLSGVALFPIACFGIFAVIFEWETVAKFAGGVFIVILAIYFTTIFWSLATPYEDSREKDLDDSYKQVNPPKRVLTGGKIVAFEYESQTMANEHAKCFEMEGIQAQVYKTMYGHYIVKVQF